MMQDGRPIAFASRTLSDAEQRYSPIEKETLAILFGCQKFHQYTYANYVIIESDHKPLESIFQKSILKSPKRL